MSGKLRGQRAKSMKFVDGLMIHSGDPCNDYVDTATRHVLLRQGVLGIKVSFVGRSVGNVVIFCPVCTGQDHVAVGREWQNGTKTSPSG